MYLIDTLYYIYKPSKRETLLSVSQMVARENRTKRFKVLADMVMCSLVYGCMWTEYGDLDFYHRSTKNRKTYITTFFNFRLYDKVNLKSKRDIFHEKLSFLKIFSEFVKREWINTDMESEQHVKEFLDRHRVFVAKASYGDSGKEVEVIDVDSYGSLDDVLNYLRTNHFNLLEEKIKNHPALERLNPTSLNTVRIVTVKNQSMVNVLFAGIRVGGEGSEIDNLSQGGKVARIDIETGKIDSEFYTKISSYNKSMENVPGKNAIGYQLPYWEGLVAAVKRAAYVVPEISIVAWDIAITEDGVDFVEGNESFGSVIMQLYSGHDEAGLKPRLLSML